MAGSSTQRHRTRIVMWTIVGLGGIAALIPVAKFAGTMATVYRLRSLRPGDACDVPCSRTNLRSNLAVIRSAVLCFPPSAWVLRDPVPILDRLRATMLPSLLAIRQCHTDFRPLTKQGGT